MANEKKEIVITPEEMAMLMQLGGGAEQGGVFFPSLRLQHTTDYNGDANPLKGHYTLTERNDLGEWIAQDLGDTIELQFLMRRYRLYMVKGDTTYSTKEFDSPLEQIQLTQKVGTDIENMKMRIHSTGTVQELQQQFLNRGDDGSVKTDLKLLSVLYCKIGDQVCKWKMNMSATMAYSKFAKSVMPFAVITECKAQELKNGSVKYYAPLFRAVRGIDDVKAAVEAQKGLRDVFGAFNATPAIAAPADVMAGKEEIPF